MVSVPIHNTGGEQVGTYEFDPDEIVASVSKQLLHDAVVMYEANLRQGNAKSKSRAEVIGSGKKMYRQKGTGRARMGNKRTHIRRGGGHAFAKRPRDFGYRLPKKALRVATRMALRSKFDDGQVVIVDDLSLSVPKTKPVFEMLRALGLQADSCLLTVADANRNVWLSARNIAGVLVSPAAELNAYVLLKQKRLLVTKAALDRLRGVDTAASGGEASGDE